MKFINLILKYTFFILIFTFFENKPSSFEIDLYSDWQNIVGVLKEELPASFLLAHFKLESDLLMDDFEKKQLLNFQLGQVITLDQIKRAVLYLKKKNHFESIQINLKKMKSGRELSIKLKSFWVFSKIKIKTRIQDKDRYLQNYLLEFGERFDKEKHFHSIEKIKNELQSDGYLNVNVHDELKFDDITKTVSGTLKFENLQRFVINDLDIVLTTGQGELEDGNFLRNKLIKIANLELNNVYYNKTLIDKFAATIKNYLLKKGYFVGKTSFQNFINYQTKRVKIIFTVDLTHKKKLVFFGNHFFNNNDLLVQLTVFGQSALLMPASMLVDQLETLYKKRGFWDVQVEWKDEQDSYYFVINEGPRAKLTDVELIGAEWFDSESLVDQCFSELIKSKFFDSEILRHSIDKLTTKYMQDGFWDFSVLEQKFLAINPGDYKLILQIEQGPRRMLEAIEIEKFPFLLNEGPFLEFNNLKNPVPFNIDIIKEQREWLVNYLKKSGYIYTSINPEFIQGKTNLSGTLKLVWKITGESYQVKFGKTIIQTNSKLPAEIIMRELDYSEGQIWNKEKLEHSLKNLKKLSMFEYVTLVPSDFNKAEQSKDVILKALQDDPFEIRTRVGFQLVSKNIIIFNGGYSYKLGGSLLWKNPFNLADILRFDADFSRYKSDIVAAYEIPWIFGNQLRTTFKGYRSRYDQPFVFGSPQILYKAAQDGILVELNKNFSHHDFVCNFGFEFMKISELSRNLAAFIDYCPILVDRKIPYLFLEPSIFMDYLNNKLEPSYGSLTVASFKLMGAPHLPRSYFLKFLFERSSFYPVYNDIIGAFRLRFGYIFNTEFSNINPIERFYLGGAFSIRGYEQDKAPPVNFTKLSPNGLPECIVQLGGKAMVNINTELRFPIYKSFSGVLFNDIGALAQNKITDIITSNFVGATGFGFRYNTPVGALRFDLGFKWKKRFVGDSPYAWFLTLGQAF